ncbi:sulfite exporter TauE/SafE family protein [Oceanibacterium hippocampi]|uniref:Probable membrane transporter protein n=1 Tax=Oceanibacterium hippocampi TaxID=745714 RepID=A0A1Y5TYI0_9PROT|nr:sulfite exporter TauE/SafE family protein [Oceanibacterium hippocampi]SLN71274.1 hypothetical protein OCH7691_03359 [Oceanibacterium hippocampi]
MLSVIVLAIAGLSAGALNAVAGGGTFLSFPALVWVGVPPIMANATATLSALPGYIGSAWAYRRDLRKNSVPSLRAIVITAIVGGFLGALLLLVTPQAIFSGIVPWLLLLATLAFLFGPAVLRRMTRKGTSVPLWPALGLLLAVTIYGGYFNGGLGIMLLATFGIIGFTNLHEMNGLKNAISAVLSLVSVATYIAAGLIDWPSALILGVASAVGGYLGAKLARRITNVTALRVFITTVGFVMAAAFFML